MHILPKQRISMHNLLNFKTCRTKLWASHFTFRVNASFNLTTKGNFLNVVWQTSVRSDIDFIYQKCKWAALQNLPPALDSELRVVSKQRTILLLLYCSQASEYSWWMDLFQKAGYMHATKSIAISSPLEGTLCQIARLATASSKTAVWLNGLSATSQQQTSDARQRPQALATALTLHLLAKHANLLNQKMDKRIVSDRQHNIDINLTS